MNIEEAIEYLKNYKYDNEVREAIDIVLNELEKKDKVIDEMAEKLVEAHGWFYSEFDNYTKEDWKEYFYKKVQK